MGVSFKSLRRTLAASTLLVLAASHAAAGQYYNLGFFNYVSSVSSDGTVAAGYGGSGFFHWNAADGLTEIGGNSPGNGYGGTASLSADGTRLSGNYTNPDTSISEAAVYDIAGGNWTLIGTLGSASGNEASSSWGMSGDGQSVVGLGWVTPGSGHAFQWFDGVGMSDLGSTVPGASSRANGVDFDGNVVVGWQDSEVGARQGAFWQDGVQTVISYNGGVVGEASAVTPDGNWIVGHAGYDAPEPWRYNVSTGKIDLLGLVDPNLFFANYLATGVSADGSTVIGLEREFGFPPNQYGTIWKEGLGIQRLTDYALANGVPLPAGTVLGIPLAISADGKVIGGIDNNYNGFLIVIPEPTTWALGLMAGLGLIAGAIRKR